MDIVLILLFGSDGWAGAVMTLLYILGLWFMLKKSGLPGWWAPVPFAREYMLSKCAGREAEGRVTSVVSLLIAATRVGMRLLASSPDGAESAAGAALSLMVLDVMLTLILLVYSVRVYAGLIEVYGVRRRWIWPWIVFAGPTALLWGLSKKYQPLWKVEDIRKELSSIASTGSAEVLKDGLTVNLRVRTVREGFEKKILLRDVHLSIPLGHMVLLLGGSGAGKTVFLNAVSGYEKADASVMLGGEDLYRQYKKLQYQVGYAPQQDTMRGKDTIYSTLLDTARLRLPRDTTAADRRARVDEVMGLFGLTPSRSHLIEKLSGGQKKRVSIAMELISNPSLFILDEPDSGLDGTMARELMEQLRSVADRDKIVIVITHTPDRVIDLFDDVIVLAKDDTRVGRLAYYGSVDDCRAFFGTERMEDVVKLINPVSTGGAGQAETFIAKYAEVQHA